MWRERRDDGLRSVLKVWDKKPPWGLESFKQQHEWPTSDENLRENNVTSTNYIYVIASVCWHHCHSPNQTHMVHKRNRKVSKKGPLLFHVEALPQLRQKAEACSSLWRCEQGLGIFLLQWLTGSTGAAPPWLHEPGEGVGTIRIVQLCLKVVSLGFDTNGKKHTTASGRKVHFL